LLVAVSRLAQAKAKLYEFLQKSSVPYVATWAAMDLFDEKSENFVETFGVSGNRPGNYTVQRADLIICLASRLDTHETGSNRMSFSPHSRKIAIDIDKEELEKRPESNWT